MEYSREMLLDKLVSINYTRNDTDMSRGTFRVRGEVVEIFPAGQSEKAIRVEYFGDEIEQISEIDALTGKKLSILKYIIIFPASHYAMDHEKVLAHLPDIRRDLLKQAEMFKEQGKLLEAERIQQRTMYDIEMLKELGYCSGHRKLFTVF